MIFFFPIIGFVSVLLHGPMAIASIWFVITQVSISISNVIVLKLLMPDIEKICFDAVLSKEFHDNIVVMGKLNRIKKSPFIIKFRNYIWSLPSNLILPFLILRGILVFMASFIPIIGPLLVVYIKAPTRALQSHQRYFAYKSFDDKDIKNFYKSRKSEYVAFGLMANLLGSIPFLNLLFMFTNTIGAALWVVNIELQSQVQANSNDSESAKSVAAKNETKNDTKIEPVATSNQ
ncbi:hypothetical protein CLIB1444_02S09758 [[Candida] jaroonii]|uniref:Uncharacterized protein n=1 Tax=[Candida] jaroonii TaxID=467808 RepID=A0ACA9Y533_9ASCO|nr:hypothetical protein CLIB1444_02S09758 [[Candida] jaroonii]